MRRLRQLALVFAVTAVTAVGAQAQEQDFTPAREPDPRVGLSAAFINLFYVPVRFPATVVGAVVEGATGWLTAGNQHAADDAFGLFDGTQVITPEIIEYRERFRFNGYD